jgi:hypothetical protein
MDIIYTVLCIACLCVGFFVGYKINKPKEVKPVEKPKTKAKKIENLAAEEEFKKSVEKWSTILDNINNYDGTSNNQREVK